MGNKSSFNQLFGSKQRENISPEARAALHVSLTCYSSDEIKNHIQAFEIDINNPPGNLSPLHVAVSRGRVKIVRFLLEDLHANPLLEFNGKTALELAFTLYPDHSSEQMVSIMFQNFPILASRNINSIKALLQKYPVQHDWIKRWTRRKERFAFIAFAYEKKKMSRVPLSLVRDISSYI